MRQADCSQNGATLITVLVMLLLILMLGLAAAQVALQGEKAARNDRDRYIAFQAAESALLDAEMDIEQSPDPARSRSHIFARYSAMGFPLPGDASCASGVSNIYLGLCSVVGGDSNSTWKNINFFDDTSAGIHTVPYGRFTGNQFLTDVAALPARKPRYVIELIVDRKVPDLNGRSAYFYRITAIGYGARVSTQVVLQSFYRKQFVAVIPEEKIAISTGRLSWREVVNWSELNAVGR